MISKKLQLLEDIAAGNKHTLSNRAIAPLCAAGLVEVVQYRPNGYQYKKVRLTEWGKTYIQSYTK